MSDNINLSVVDEWCAELAVTLGATVERRVLPHKCYTTHRLCVMYLGAAAQAPKVPRALHPYITERHHYTPRNARSRHGVPHGSIILEWRTT